MTGHHAESSVGDMTTYVRTLHATASNKATVSDNRLNRSTAFRSERPECERREHPARWSLTLDASANFARQLDSYRPDRTTISLILTTSKRPSVQAAPFSTRVLLPALCTVGSRSAVTRYVRPIPEGPSVKDVTSRPFTNREVAP